MSGGGGGGQNTATVQQSSAFIPPWLETYGQQAVERANALSQGAYNPYPGQTVAGFDPAQQQAYNQVGQLQGLGVGGYNSAIGAGQMLADQTTPLSAGGINAGTDQLYGNFRGNVYDPAAQNNAAAMQQIMDTLGGSYNQSAGLLGNYLNNAGPATAEQVGANATALMSPYTNQVIDPARELGRQSLAQNLQQLGASSNQAGAFGGSRQGVMEGVAQAQSALLSEKYLGDMLNQSWNSALTPAYNLASQQSQQGMAAADLLSRQGAANANLMADRQYSGGQSLNQLLANGFGNSQKLGTDIMTQNLTGGINAMQQLPQSLAGLQSSLFGQTNALQQAGALQQQYQQNLINSAQGAFAQQQAFPYQQLQTLLGAISGIPYSTSNTGSASENTPFYSNPWGQGIGTAATVAGIGSQLLNSHDNLGAP